MQAELEAWNGLKPVGFWRTRLRSDLPDPSEMIDPTWSLEERARVVRYLKTGGTISIDFFGYHTCLICGKPAGTSQFGDGIWMWPEGLAHYVAEHSLRPPHEFVEHALKHSASGPV